MGSMEDDEFNAEEFDALMERGPWVELDVQLPGTVSKVSFLNEVTFRTGAGYAAGVSRIPELRSDVSVENRQPADA